jgi:hypothetical protein
MFAPTKFLRDGTHMLEFETSTLAFMTASLEQACKKLRTDTPEARRFIADRLKECARSGRVGQIALTEAGEEAVAELNGTPTDRRAIGWRILFPWAV